MLSFSASHQYLDDDPTNTPADDYVVKVQSLTDDNGGGAGIGGDIFLTGHDPDFHAQGEPGAKNLLNAGLSFATGGTHNDGANPATKFLWVESRIATPGGHRIGEDGLISIGLTLGVDYDRANGAEFATVNLSNYTAIAVASAFGGLLTITELDALIARSADIKTYINNGGGLFASSECDGTFGASPTCGVHLLGASANLFGYLPVNVSAVVAAAPFTVTAFGSGLGLVNSDLQSPTHNSFADASGLNIVDNDSAGNPTTLAGHVLVGEDALTEGLTITVHNWAPSLTGKIVVNHDEWTFSDLGFYESPTVEQFANNVANYFTGGVPGDFLAYSTDFGYNEVSLEATLTGAGHTWLAGVAALAVPFTVANLLTYDGVFLADEAADNLVLIDYVNAGGNVYLAGGTGAGGAEAEAARWNTFLNAFGMEFLFTPPSPGTYNGIGGNIAPASANTLLTGVATLFSSNGNTINITDGTKALLLMSQGGSGLLAVAKSGLITGTVSSNSIDEGQSITVDATFTDPGLLDIHTAVIDWGDGSLDETQILSVGVRTFNAVHAYGDRNR